MKFIFTSSLAVFGGELPPVIDDRCAVTPQSSYGAQKAMCELLINDYARKGFVDGRVLRLPTISVRPGKPNKAASSFASGIIREPLHGEQAVCPVNAELALWLSSPAAVVSNFIHAATLPASAFGALRTLNLPGISVRVREMLEALRAVAGDVVAARVRFEPDAAINRIVAGWPGEFDTQRARHLGFIADESFEQAIRAFIRDDMPQGGDDHGDVYPNHRAGGGGVRTDLPGAAHPRACADRHADRRLHRRHYRRHGRHANRRRHHQRLRLHARQHRHRHRAWGDDGAGAGGLRRRRANRLQLYQMAGQKARGVGAGHHRLYRQYPDFRRFGVRHPLSAGQGAGEKGKRNLLTLGVALAGGLILTHHAVPPTPGPLGVAGIFGVDIGAMMLAGLVLAIPCVIGIVLYARWLGTRYPDFMPQEEEAPQDLRAAHQQYLAEKEGKALPSLMLSLLPILTPIGLIFVNAVNNMLAKREGMGWLAESLWGQSFAFLGSPMIALAISVLLAVYTLMPHANKHDTLERLEEGLQTAGIILLVTGAGGALGAVLRESGAGTQLAQQVAGLPISPVLIPFVIATLVRVIQDPVRWR